MAENLQHSSEEKVGSLLIGLAALLAFLVRVYRLDAFSLSVDESFSAAFSSHLGLAVKSIHPPLYYMLLGAWKWIFSDWLYALRLPSVFAGTISVVLIARLGEKLINRRAGIIAAFMLACLPLHAAISREADVHVFSAALALLAALLAVRLTEEGADRTHAGLLAAANVLGLLTTHLFVLCLLQQFLMLVCMRGLDRVPRRGLAVAFGAPAGLLVLATPLLYSQFKTLTTQLAAFPSLSRIWEAPLADWVFDMGLGAPWNFVWNASWTLGFIGGADGPMTSACGETVAIVLSFAGALVFVMGAAACFIRKSNGRMAALALFFGPVAVLFLLSFAFPVWSPGAIYIFLPFYALILAAGADSLRRAVWPAVALFTLAAMTGVILNANAGAGPSGAWRKPPDWKAVAKELSGRYAAADTLVVTPGWMSQALLYHLRHVGVATSAMSGGGPAVVEIPFDFYNPNAPLANRVEIPQAERTWVAHLDPFPWENVDKLMEGAGRHLSQRVNFWHVGLLLYMPVSAAVSEVPASGTKEES